MISRFGRPVPQLCMIYNQTLEFIFSHWGHLLTDWNKPWLTSRNLQNYANIIHRKGSALDNVWGFVDGTVRQCSRPLEDQRTIYNGHKRVHGLKFQSISTPNGLIVNLFGPVEGKRHDSAMLAMSNLLQNLRVHSYGPNRNILCVYGDPAYPLTPFLQGPYKLRAVQLTQQQKDFNKSMSACRVSVEWLFGDIVNTFKFVDFKKELKLGLSPIGKTYLVSGILTNAHACLYGNTTSLFFDMEPPIIEEYFV